MAKEIELRSHTDSDGDVLTRDGIEAAIELGTALRGCWGGWGGLPDRSLTAIAPRLLM